MPDECLMAIESVVVEFSVGAITEYPYLIIPEVSFFREHVNWIRWAEYVTGQELGSWKISV